MSKTYQKSPYKEVGTSAQDIVGVQRKTPTKTMDDKIEAILRKYWFDPYNKNQYIKCVKRDILELITP